MFLINIFDHCLIEWQPAILKIFFFPQVFLVDYGFTITANMTDLRDIKKQYLILPFQVIEPTAPKYRFVINFLFQVTKCCLANVKRKELSAEKLNDAYDFLELCVLQKTLEAKVVYTMNHLKILLSDENGIDIGEQLVESSLVEECTDYISNARIVPKMLVD